MKNSVKYIFLFFVLSLLANNLFSSHAGGMDISYECVSQQSTFDLYKVKIKFYRDCSGSPAPSDIQLTYSSSCGSDFVDVSQTSGPLYITPTCTQSGTPCSGGSLVELEEYEYEKIISLDKCSDWLLTACVNNRNVAITTIVDPSNQPLCVQAEINNLIHCNNSPDFTEYPTPYICANQSFCYNNGAIDSDGDSLVYSLANPLNSANSGVTYNPGLSFLNPITGTTNFDPVTGNLCMNANNLQVSVIAMKISEFRNGIFIGSILRDIQIIVLSCTTAPPILSGFNGFPADVTNAGLLDDSLNLCVNDFDSINFSIEASLGSSSNKVISWSGLSNSISIPTFNIVNNNTSNPIATFNWTPQTADAINSPYTFNVTVEDDACPINNVFSYTYTITLNSSTLFDVNYLITDQSCSGIANGAIDLTISGNNPSPIINWSGPNSFSSNFVDLDSLFSGDYILSVTDISGCQVIDTFSVASANPYSISYNIDSVSCTGLNDGSITPIISGLNNLFSINWYSLNSQLPLWYTFSNTLNIDSLYSGIYVLNFMDSINNNNCLFNDTIILMEPNPFNATYNIYPPSCNGYSDGYIDLNISSNNNSLIFNWTGPNNFIDNNEDISSLISGNYFLEVSDPNSCSFFDTVIVVNPPVLISNDSIVICDSYNWNGNTYSITGNYSWTSVNSFGCDTSALLNLQITSSTSSIISIYTCEDFLWNGILYDTSGIYFWNGINSQGCDSLATLDLNINSVSSSYIDTIVCNELAVNGKIYSETGIYIDTILNINGCDSIITLDVKITSFKITALSPICSNDSTIIDVLIDNPFYNFYSLFFTTNQVISSYNIDSLGNELLTNNNILLGLSQNSQIILEYAIDNNGCKKNINDTISVIVNPLPNISLTIDDICQNTEPFLLNYGFPSNGIYYLNNTEITILEPKSLNLTSYQMKYSFTDSLTSCSNILEKTFSILESPISNFTITPLMSKVDSQIIFINNSLDFNSCTWSLGDENYYLDSILFNYSYQNTGQYLITLSVVNSVNCIDSSSAIVTIYPSYSIYIPNSFSPDFDLINDSFYPKGSGINSYKIIIFSRWGEKVKVCNNTPWDGKDFPLGVYPYKIEINDFKNELLIYDGLVRLIK